LRAKQMPQKNDATTKPGLGFVDVFTARRVLTKRLASGGTVVAPWGVARNPEFRQIQRRRSDRKLRHPGKRSPDRINGRATTIVSSARCRSTTDSGY